MYTQPCAHTSTEWTSVAAMSKRVSLLVVGGAANVREVHDHVAAEDVVRVVAGMRVSVVHSGRAVLPLVNLSEAWQKAQHNRRWSAEPAEMKCEKWGVGSGSGEWECMGAAGSVCDC